MPARRQYPADHPGKVGEDAHDGPQDHQNVGDLQADGICGLQIFRANSSKMSRLLAYEIWKAASAPAAAKTAVWITG